MNPVLTVSQFNSIVNEVINPLDVVVEGEISQWQVWQNKYIYGAIKDENATAQIFATIFDVRNASQLTVGMKVKVKGKPSVHIKSGKLSLTAKEITPSGEGAMLQAFEILKKKLESEGMFDKNRKREIPAFPENIGFITAKGSQAYNDFTKIIEARWPGARIHFYPAQVQGKESVQSIIDAVKFFNEKFEEKDIDVVVIARGGGSSEDLIAFNDEQLVRAVFGSKFPTVSGVGHEGDVTLIDYVTDLRASTPSNAAELISPNKIELLEKFSHYQSMLYNDIKMLVDNTEKDLADSTVRLTECAQSMTKTYEEKISNYSRLLNSYSYKDILKRGFAIVRNNKDKIVRSSDELKNGDSIKVEFDSSEIDAKVITVEKVDNLSIF